MRIHADSIIAETDRKHQVRRFTPDAGNIVRGGNFNRELESETPEIENTTYFGWED